MGIFKFFSELEISTGGFADFSEIQDVYNAMMAVLCVVCAGLAAGLTMGLLSLDVTKLEIKTMTGSPKEKVAAQAILPIVRQHHLLLVTLLLFNSVANETLPIFLGALMPNYLAVILSVTLVLIFGEILPSALFTGPSQLLTAARLTNLVYFLFALFYPIAFPISKVLDYAFGADDMDGNISRVELEALVILQGNEHRRLHRENSLMSDGGSDNNSKVISNSAASSEPQSTPSHDSVESGEGLSTHEVNLMTGVLRLSKYTIKNAMIPAKKVFMISGSTHLNEKSLYDILDCGFSRILVYRRHDRQHLMGYMLVKTLIVVNPLDETMVENLPLREPLFVQPSQSLFDLLQLFQESHCHLAVVSEDPVAALNCLRSGQRPSGQAVMSGIVTLEDVLEKIIQSDIVDETDAVIYPSIYPNGGAPTVFYHHVIRPSVYGKGAKSGNRPSDPKSSLSAAVRKRNDYRHLMLSQSSVVKSENYGAIRRNYATFPPREHVVHVLQRMEGGGVSPTPSDSAEPEDEEHCGENSLLLRPTGS